MSPKRSVYLSLLCLSVLLLPYMSDAKTVSNSVSKPRSKVSTKLETSEPQPQSENVFLRFAKSIALEALSEFKESARRNPKLGFNFTFPMIPGLNTTTGGGNDTLGALGGAAAVVGIPVTIGVGTVGLKSTVVAGLLGLKTFLVGIVLNLLLLAFLISGTAYFVCNLGLVSCGGLGGGAGGSGGGLLGGGSGGSLFGGGGGSGGGNPLGSLFSSRTGMTPEQAQPIYKAIDEGYKKYQ